MILLDTDHFTVLRYSDDRRYTAFVSRLNAAVDQLPVVSIVTFEEQMKGWLAEINRHRSAHDQVTIYHRLAKAIDLFRQWQIIAFDNQAAEKFESLRRQRVRIGTRDLKIASIALVHDALLLSANLRDFREVPGLRIENWLA